MISDEQGGFIFENIPVGRYQMRADYVGYQSVIVSEVLVSTVSGSCIGASIMVVLVFIVLGAITTFKLFGYVNRSI